MKHPFFYLLRPALIPEQCADISAGSAGNVHLILIPVFAVRTFPDKLSVIILYYLYLTAVSAALTVIALCIKLRIHYIIINITYYLHYSRNVLLHIRHLNIGNCSSG